MFKVEVDDFGERVDFCDLELPDEVCETIPKFGIYVANVSALLYIEFRISNIQTMGSKEFLPSMLSVD